LKEKRSFLREYFSVKPVCRQAGGDRQAGTGREEYSEIIL